MRLRVYSCMILNSFLCSFQVKSGKELKAFLFNDFLMLTRPRSSITGNLSKKIGFNEQEVIYDIYRKVRRVRISLASVDVPISSPEFPLFWSKETERPTPWTKSKTWTRKSCFQFHCTLAFTRFLNMLEIGDVYSLCLDSSLSLSCSVLVRFPCTNHSTPPPWLLIAIW